ncbi:MAG TPA: class I SAM-dependent rRNA methyltransferase [Planctomycetota bacterium]|jgi:23S rRNA (cytosine1962-C5)-methyltransferase|nr:class I SAM-dependent rRNA methyltransferase [Planctomycetota bacterium]
MSDVLPPVRLLTDELPKGPWIFGRQVETRDAPLDGSLVEVLDHSGRFCGHGLYNGASDIRVRLLSRGKKSELRNPRDFLLRRLASADRIRKKVLRLPEVTDAYRIVHAEGDDLPGLIVDKLGDCLVCEHHSLGFWKLRRELESALSELYPEVPIVHRVPPSVTKSEGFTPEEPTADLGQRWIKENGLAFPVRPGHGHKTGWFCDQRDNRVRVASFARGQDVLDLCCNAGGFALHAARAGASRVRGIDLDEVPIASARDAAAKNGLAAEFIHADAFDVLRSVREERSKPGVVVVDPHKIVKTRMQLEAGLKRYSDLNTLALECVRPGGVVATFSCSGILDLPSFLGMVFQAARRAGREIRLLETLGAGPDHPQRPEFSRSRYLKGALLAVD